MAIKFKSKLVFGKTGVFDSIGVGVQDPGGNLHISGRDLRLTSGSAHFDSRPLVNGFPVMLSGDTVSIDVSDLYPANNPSGFITGISNLVYTTGNQTISGVKNFTERPTLNGTGFLLIGEAGGGGGGAGGDYYPNNNPSGFLTTGSLTGYLQLSQTGAFYPASNPSGFITGIDLSSYITNAQTGQFYPTSNPSGFLTVATVSGSYVASTPANISGASQIKNMIRITQSGYNALTPDSETLYIIVG
jgi:hypothetical protein